MRLTRDKILNRADARAWRDALREDGKSLVFTNGCFDLLHPGHIGYLTEARALGNALLVAANTDASVRRVKGDEPGAEAAENAGLRRSGPPRPIVPEAERAEVLAALRCVDAVTLFDDDTPAEIIRELLPDILVKGADWALDAIVGRDTIEAAGGRVVRLPLVGGYSTTRIIEAAHGGGGTLRTES